jgi:hypothetical protein
VMVQRVEEEMARRSEVAYRDEMREIAITSGEENDEKLNDQNDPVAERLEQDSEPEEWDKEERSDSDRRSSDSSSDSSPDSDDSPISDAGEDSPVSDSDFDSDDTSLDDDALDEEIPLFDADFQEQLWGMSEEDAEKKRREYLQKNKKKVAEIKDKWKKEKQRRKNVEKRRAKEMEKQRQAALADKRKFEDSLRKTEQERKYRELELSGQVAIRKPIGKSMKKNGRNKCGGGLKDSPACGDTVHIFSVASGHLYEELLSIMILSVRRNTDSPLHFWFIDTFLSPKFKTFLPILAEKVGFEFSFVSYKWPSWLNFQEDKQRLIWAYYKTFNDRDDPKQ